MYVISTLKRPVPLEHYLYTGLTGKSKDERFLIVNAEGAFVPKGYITSFTVFPIFATSNDFVFSLVAIWPPWKLKSPRKKIPNQVELEPEQEGGGERQLKKLVDLLLVEEGVTNVLLIIVRLFLHKLNNFL